MRSYADLKIFSGEEKRWLARATELVAGLGDEFASHEKVRCHELARAVGRLLGLPVQDGHYGFVEHSWLWTREPRRLEADGDVELFGAPNILDVYAVGQLPQVQLVAGGRTGLPHVGWAYRPGERRRDVRTETVVRIVQQTSRIWGGWGAAVIPAERVCP